jgi:hypothetical protein
MQSGSWCRLLLIVCVLLLSATAAAQERALNIRPIAQSTPVWCWAAVGEMVFRYYGVPNVNPARHYQCGVVGAFFGGACAQDCKLCIVPAGQMKNLAAMIDLYPRIAAQSTGQPTRKLGALLGKTATTHQIITEINRGRPLVAGISPSGILYPPGLAEHVALIVGYRYRIDDLQLIVNDPYPFPPGADPYRRVGAQQLQPGQYLIPYSVLARHFGWNSTILIVE